MNVWELTQRLFCVHKCAACRTILDQAHFYNALCPRCAESFGRAKIESCPECLRSAVECSCQPKMLIDGGSLCLRRLYFYSSDRENEPQNRLLYNLKRRTNARTEEFVARELYALVCQELDTLGIENVNDEVAIVNLPRGRRAVIEKGFDQSARICQALSRISSIPYLPAVKRRFGGKEQKKLNATERKKNMRSLMRPDMRYAEQIKGRYVILLDDVVTTGASMSSCLPILRKMGVRGVICCAVASDIKKKKQR